MECDASQLMGTESGSPPENEVASLCFQSLISLGLCDLCYLFLSLCSVFLSAGSIPLLTHGLSDLHTTLLQLVWTFAIGPTMAMTPHNP